MGRDGGGGSPGAGVGAARGEEGGGKAWESRNGGEMGAEVAVVCAG